jgi:hypothetical protein
VAALHWTRAPKLYYIFCCLLTFSYLPNTFCTFLVTDWLNFIAHLLMCPITLCMFLVADWLNLIAYPLLCPITRKISAPLQSVTSINLCVLTSHLVQRRLLGHVRYNLPVSSLLVDLHTCIHYHSDFKFLLIVLNYPSAFVKFLPDFNLMISISLACGVLGYLQVQAGFRHLHFGPWCI